MNRWPHLQEPHTSASSPHFRHTHTFPFAPSGTFSSASAEIFTFAHQHSLLPAAMPHSFGPPQIGHRSGFSSLIRSPDAPPARRTPAHAAPPRVPPPAPVLPPAPPAPAPDSRTPAAASARSSGPRPESGPVLTSAARHC